MASRFCVLASSSSGNCTFLQADGFGVLIDIGIGPRFIASRLASMGASWADVHAVLLTHTHADHWKEWTLRELARRRIPLYCTSEHANDLALAGAAIEPLAAAGLVRTLKPGATLMLRPGLHCRAIAVPHDSEPTLAFRLDGPTGPFAPEWSIGYAADLGEPTADLLELFRGVHVLALEFNHCERMERSSGRPRHLIERVLSPRGHLSNRQAADFVRQLGRAGGAAALRHLVQLHLSRQCNRPRLAAEFGRAALADLGVTAAVMTALPQAASWIITLDDGFVRSRPCASAAAASLATSADCAAQVKSSDSDGCT